MSHRSVALLTAELADRNRQLEQRCGDGVELSSLGRVAALLRGQNEELQVGLADADAEIRELAVFLAWV